MQKWWTSSGFTLGVLLIAGFSLTFAGCGGGSSTPTVPPAGVVTVDLTATKQIIRGFGAASVWCGAVLDGDMDLLFTDKGIGLSILRVRIAPNSNWSSSNYSSWSQELSNAKKAIARNATVFATPWTPPGSMKIDYPNANKPEVGGKLNPSEYANYANYLKSFVDYFAQNGVPLDAISIQNEPDIKVDYESCDWTAAALRDFLHDNGGIIAGNTSNTKIIMPESMKFNTTLSDPTLNDTMAASYVSIIGGHLYGTKAIKDYPLARSQGKELWMTEWCYVHDPGKETEEQFKTRILSLGEALNVGKQIHDCMTLANMNAYVWWYATGADSYSPKRMNGLIYNSVMQKRGYVMGQFARFVRPGYYRIDATANPNTNVYVSAYKGENKVIIVAINKSNTAVSETFTLYNGITSQVSVWLTDANHNITAGSAITVSGGSFTATLPAQSVTTFVGTL